MCKIYAESLRSKIHLKSIQDEALRIAQSVFAAAREREVRLTVARNRFMTRALGLIPFFTRQIYPLPENRKTVYNSLSRLCCAPPRVGRAFRQFGIKMPACKVFR